MSVTQGSAVPTQQVEPVFVSEVSDHVFVFLSRLSAEPYFLIVLISFIIGVFSNFSIICSKRDVDGD